MNTYKATCPITGETRTRKTEHVYTHSVSFKVTKVFEPVPDTHIILHGTTAPKGYVLIRKTTKAHWGSACKVVPIPAEQQKEEIISNLSFHSSKAIAEKVLPPVSGVCLYKFERFVHEVTNLGHVLK